MRISCLQNKAKRRALVQAFILNLDVTLIVGLVVLVLWKLGVAIPLWALVAAVAVVGGAYWLNYKAIVTTQDQGVLMGAEGMLGLTGVAVTPLRPEGMIKVWGELWKALSWDGSVMMEGERVEVVDIRGLQLFVRGYFP